MQAPGDPESRLPESGQPRGGRLAPPVWLLTAALALSPGLAPAQTEHQPASGEVRPAAASLGADPEEAAVRSAIDRGLGFLRKRQLESGAIGGRYPVAVTALSGLSVLGAGNRYRDGPYAPMLRQALRFLLESGSAGSGYISDAESRMHGHCFAILFLTQLYGELPAEEQAEVERRIREGVEVIRQSQSDLGGWYYTPENTDRADEASITICALQALRAANGIGFLVPKSTVDRAARYVRECQASDGSFKYSLRGGDQHTSFALTVAAISTLHAAGRYDDPVIKRSLDYSRRCIADGVEKRGEAVKAADKEFFAYANLYAAQAFYQVGGDLWTSWYPSARRFLLKREMADGSWSDDGYGSEFGTACALLVLEVPLNYLPAFQR
jgi:hypothetical protein